METLFIYLLKSSGLIVAFYISYFFLLRKETFFTSNRWFLIVGLITSVVLPLFFIKKIIWVEKPKISVDDLVLQSNQLNPSAILNTQVTTINWTQIITIGYILVVLFLILKVIFNLISLFRLLRNKKIQKYDNFAFVDLKEDVAPFSFFNFIVFNSSLYTHDELQSILLHEKVHSQQKHSFDVLIAKLFCIVFWFNPFIWLYKKVIIQNLEYIADNKAIQLIEDKKSYQKALLKVVSHQNCLPLTNPFYQSLIKKRIVMLNKNQSHKRNSWKYAVVIPALIAFVYLFQVKIIAQERISTKSESRSSDVVYVTTNKNSSDEEMKKDATLLKEKYGVTLKFSKVKRNAKGEITRIKVEFKDKEGNSGVTQFNGNEPIKPIYFYKTDDKIGFGKANSNSIYSDNYTSENYSSDYENATSAYSFEVPELAEIPELNEIPEAPELSEIPELPELPEPLSELGSFSNSTNRIVIQNDNEKPIIIVNGEVVEGADRLTEKELKEYVYNYSSHVKKNRLSKSQIAKIKAEALANSRIEIKRMRPQIFAQAKKDMERAREEMERARPEMERAREEMERSRPDMEKAREDMLKAREDMLKAKAEMEKAKAELDKARAELKK